MEQLLFNTEDSTLLTAGEIYSKLVSVLKDEDLISVLKVTENKDKSISVKFKSELICKFINKKGASYVDFKSTKFLKDVQNPIALEAAPYNVFSFIGNVFAKTVFSHTGDTFACCGSYLECSDKKKCVHPNFLHALGCSYRKNLENGRIFYGKNKNT